jgi:hypothetical protein
MPPVPGTGIDKSTCSVREFWAELQLLAEVVEWWKGRAQVVAWWWLALNCLKIDTFQRINFSVSTHIRNSD